MNKGLDLNIFQRSKKTGYGALVRELNNVDAVANLMLNAHLEGISPFDKLNVLSELSPDDVYNFICSELRSDRIVLSVIEKDGVNNEL